MEHTVATEPSEIKYINKRKRKAWRESLCFYLCRIFPIDTKLVSVCTFEGKGGFGCNPKYVVQELHRQNPNIKFVWFVNEDIYNEKTFPDYVKKIPNTLWNRAFWLSISKVWIDNYRKPYGTKKRRKQYYLNVNHYTEAIKCTGLHRGIGFSEMAYIVSKNDSDMIDDLVIDSKWCEQCFDKGLVYEGNYLKVGSPRCDALYGDRTKYHNKFCEKHNISIDSKVIMFAPTFREGAKDGKRYVFSEIWTLDFKRLIENLEKKFGGTWYLCIRIHPQLAPTFNEYKNDKIQDRLIDESHADDMYEILAGMDAYITDYSSACFEAGFAKMPVFLFADDIEKYTHDRGSLMWNLDINDLSHIPNNKEMTPELDVELPFSISTNNDELERHIWDFDNERYQKALSEFNDKVGLIFDGTASKKISDVILKKMAT